MEGIAFAAGSGRAIWPTTWAWARRSKAWARPKSSPGGRHQQSAGRLPRFAEVAMAQRDPPFFRPQRSACHRQPAERAAQYDSDSLLHRVQLRAGVARHPADRAGPLGPDHAGRRTADQELGVEDGADRQRAAVEVRAGAYRHALGKPARRALFGGPVRRRSPTAARLPLLPPPPRGRREGEGEGYKNLDQLRENLRPILLRRTREACFSSCRRGPTKSSASRRPTSRRRCTRPTCASCR